MKRSGTSTSGRAAWSTARLRCATLRRAHVRQGCGSGAQRSARSTQRSESLVSLSVTFPFLLLLPFSFLFLCRLQSDTRGALAFSADAHAAFAGPRAGTRAEKERKRVFPFATASTLFLSSLFSLFSYSFSPHCSRASAALPTALRPRHAGHAGCDGLRFNSAVAGRLTDLVEATLGREDGQRPVKAGRAAARHCSTCGCGGRRRECG